MSKPDISSLLPDQWDYDILEDGRIVYFHLGRTLRDKSPFQWIPPLDTWKLFNKIILESGGISLPFGIELAYDGTGNSYYLSHISQQTFRDFPGVATADFNQGTIKKLKEVDISRHPLVGYGFMLSKNPPLFVSHVVPGGPADGKLIQGDLLYCIHGHDVTLQASTEDVLGAIETSLDPHVLQVAVVPRPKPRNKRPPPPPTHKAKVRFNTPLFEVMSEDDGSFIRIRSATGSEHVLRVTTELTFNDVTTALRDKLHMNCPVETLGIVATRQSNRITLPPALLVNQSFLRSCDGWRFHLRIRILPITLDELSIRCPASLSYLYSQTSHDIYSGYFIVDVTHLAELLAIRIWHEFMRTYSGRSRSRKPNQKSIRKMGGFDVFLPRIWIERSTLLSKKDLCKQIFNQFSRCKIPNEESSIMLLFLKKCLQYISAFGGTLFYAQVEFLDKVTRICVSPAMGISEEKVSVNDIKSAPIYSPIVDFSEIVEVYVTEFSRRDDLSKVRLCCVNGKELIFIMRLYDGCELGEVLQAYYRQRVQRVDILKDTISKYLCKKSSPISPIQRDTLPSFVSEHESISSTIQSTTSVPIPPYQSTHLVPPQIWSYLFNSPSPPDTLMQFSPLNLPINLSKKVRVSSSGSRGSGSRIRESEGEFGDHMLAATQSETYFSDSFDEITDSESEEYTLEVPTQFLKESLERVNVIKEKVISADIPLEINAGIQDSTADTYPPDINDEVIPTEHFKESYTVPVTLTGIPPPPVLKGAEISFERLNNLVKTPPSPTGFDIVDETLSPFTSGFIPRSASDKSLKARSDTILSTHLWHSKYEHLYPRILGLHTLTQPFEAKKNIYKTTHVDATSKELTTAKNMEDFQDDDISENFNDSHRNTDILNSESVDSLLPLPVNSDSEQESDPNLMQIADSSNDDLYSEPSFDDECIVLRLPPPIPIITHDAISDPITLQVEVSPIDTTTESTPYQTRALNNPSPPFLPTRMFASISEYKPIARRRSNIKEPKYCSDPVILPENVPKFDNSPETLRRPPSMFAEIDYSLSSVQRIPIPRSSFGPKCVQAPVPAHRPLSNRVGYRPLPPKATPRRPSDSKEHITILNKSSEYDKPSSDHYSSIRLTSDSDLKLLYQGDVIIQHEIHSISNFQTKAKYKSLVSDSTLLDQQSIADIPSISDQCMFIEPDSNTILSEVGIDALAQLLEHPSPTNTMDDTKFPSNEVGSLSQSLTTELKIPITIQDTNKHERTDFLVNLKPGDESLNVNNISHPILQLDPDNILTQPILNVIKTDGKNSAGEELLSLTTSFPSYTNTKTDDLIPMDPSCKSCIATTTMDMPIIPPEGPNKSQQGYSVMILTDPDPTHVKSITEQLMQQFNILDPETSEQLVLPTTTHERLINPTCLALTPPDPIIIKPPERSQESMPLLSSRQTSNQLEEDSILQMPFNDILTDYETATSVESAHYTQHSITPIGSIHIHEDSQKVRQPSEYVRAGNTEIRSARSIELFERNPSFDPTQRSPLPPLHLSLPIKLNLVSASTEDYPERDSLSSSDDSSAPPIPTTDPPELDLTDTIELNQ